MAVTSVAPNQVAHVLSDVPLVAFADDGARGILESDMRLGVRDALDQLCFAALTAAGLPNNNFATEPLLEKVRKAISVVAAAGYARDTLAVSPANMETPGPHQVHRRHLPVPDHHPRLQRPAVGLRAVVSKRVTDTLVFDSRGFATLYPPDSRSPPTRRSDSRRTRWCCGVRCTPLVSANGHRPDSGSVRDAAQGQRGLGAGHHMGRQDLPAG
jgi:hypothetical protein